MGPEIPLGSSFLWNIKSLTFDKKRGFIIIFLNSAIKSWKVVSVDVLVLMIISRQSETQFFCFYWNESIELRLFLLFLSNLENLTSSQNTK